MLLIGVDYHPSFQTIAFFDEETGECGEQELNHSDGQAERFYRDLQQRGIRVRVGMEAAEQEARKRPEVVRLMTHPGVGSLTALAYVLIIGTPQRFHCGKQIGTYVGMIPSEDSSGGQQRLGHISKPGNSLLRFLLVEAAQAAARSHPDWRRRYLHLAMRRHKSIAQGGFRTPSGSSPVLDVAEPLRVCAVDGVRLVRGTARYRTWCEIEHRPLGWASRSL